MLAKCSNAECEAPFDYREGRLIRFSGTLANGKPSAGQSWIQHFWLCGKCAGRYVFECKSGLSVKIKPRDQQVGEGNPSCFGSAA
jgi:hypothetical protein